MINQLHPESGPLPTPRCQPAHQRPHCRAGGHALQLEAEFLPALLRCQQHSVCPTPADQGELCPGLGFPSARSRGPLGQQLASPGTTSSTCPLPRSVIPSLPPASASAPLLPPGPRPSTGLKSVLLLHRNRFFPPCRTDTQTHHPDSCRGRFCLSCWEAVSRPPEAVCQSLGGLS